MCSQIVQNEESMESCEFKVSRYIEKSHTYKSLVLCRQIKFDGPLQLTKSEGLGRPQRK